MPVVVQFSEEQFRTLVNIEQRYEVWMEAERTLLRLPYGMHRKSIGGHAYLYEIHDRLGNGRSLGPWTTDQERRLAEYRTRKADARHRRRASRAGLAESGLLARALRLPLLANEAGRILREADRRDLLSSNIVVVGKAAMAAYTAELGGIIRDASIETGPLDLMWIGADPPHSAQIVRDMLQALYPVFAVDPGRAFRARGTTTDGAKLRIAPSFADVPLCINRAHPVSPKEREWLLRGKPVRRVLACRDGSSARIFAPDPRWFALCALWMADQKGRNTIERSSDRRQGLLLLDAIAEALPHYPVNAEFAAQLPVELANFFADWSAGRHKGDGRAW